MEIAIDLHSIIEEDWLADEYTKLFVGIDRNGEYVHPKSAITLECWKYIPKHLRPSGPAFKEAPEALVLALLRKGGKFYSLYNNLETKSTDQAIKWLSTLHRFPEGDLNEVTANLNRIA